MPDIGSTLRDARMRARIDISEIESETKIRAKYLRALENEEWDLLPGPAYVKSFLRTYADALGLDSKLLLEEYKLRHERLSDVELQPIHAPSRRARPAPRGLPRGWAIGLVVGALLVALYLLGKSAGDGGSDKAQAPPPKATPAPTSSTPARRTTRPAASRKRRSRIVRLQVVPTGTVYVCLEAKGSRVLINGATLQAGQASSTFRSSHFRLNLGNNAVRLRVDGKARTVPASSDGIGYDITRARTKRLPTGQRPTCQ